MRLSLLYNVLFLLCLYAGLGLAAGGQTLAYSRAHQLRKVDRTHTNDRSSGQALPEENPRPPKPPLNPGAVAVPRTPRKLVRRDTSCRSKYKFCRSATSTNSTTSSSKSSARIHLPQRGELSGTLTTLVVVFCFTLLDAFIW